MNRRTFLQLCGSLALIPTPATAAPQAYAVTGTLLLPTGETVPEHAVLIKGERIQAIIPANEVGSLTTLGGGSSFIMPGVINCHVHRIHSASDRRERYLDHGVTAIGDVASPLEALPELLVSPSGATATASCAGPMLCPPGGYPLPVHSPDHALVVTSPEDGREKVRFLADMGATMIKLAFEPGPNPIPWPVFDLPTASAICNEARRLGMTARCHVEDLGGLEPALLAGVHTIEHAPHRWLTDGKARAVLDNGEPIPKYTALLDQMVRDDVILTPTLDVLSRSIWDGPELCEPVRYFANAGGAIAVGNDHPYRRTEAGMPLREMMLLSQAGLPLSATLKAATINSATACGMTDRGALRPGLQADILVLSDTPMNDITLLSNPTHIIKDGRLHK